MTPEEHDAYVRFTILVDHEVACRERGLQRTETTWPDVSDIYTETIRKLDDHYREYLA